MWAMFGVQLFKGKLYRCYDAANMVWYGVPFFPGGSMYTAAPVMSGAESVPTIVECVAAGGGGMGQWEDRAYSFNNYPVAFLTCFSMATTEGWLDVMAAHADATSEILPYSLPAAISKSLSRPSRRGVSPGRCIERSAK